MFPTVEISIQGLQPDHLYSVFISVQMKDQSRYRYNSTRGWQIISRDSKPIPDRKVRHADSKNTGSHFMKNLLSFKTVKMTNNFNTTRDDQVKSIKNLYRNYFEIEFFYSAAYSGVNATVLPYHHHPLPQYWGRDSTPTDRL